MNKLFALVFVPVLGLLVSCTGSKEEAPPAPAAAPVSAAAMAGPKFKVNGKVTFAGAVPNDLVKMNADRVCAEYHKNKVVRQYSLVVGQGNGLAHAFVTIKEGATLGGAAAPTTAATIDQKGCLYEPHILGVRVGQPVTILNSDPTMHNVNAVSKVGQGFNAGMPTAGQKMEKKFTKPEMVRLKCDVHGWMNAYVGVVDHPFFAVTDKDGNFTISDLPAGKYTAEVWHEKLGTKTGTVTIEGKDGDVTVAF